MRKIKLKLTLQYYEFAVVTDGHWEDLWNGRRCKIIESPGEAPPWPCGVDHVVGNISALGTNGWWMMIVSSLTD
ncbi:hypothetical protein TSMEX_001645 [Taenia solium]|eukprot:TsM_000891700 transcript=TsM_000891700 gene=TsM_000891700